MIHLLSDLLGFLFSLLFVVLSTKKAPKEYTYGYIRAEIIGALCSVLIIWIMSIWIAIESITRLIRILKHQHVHIDPTFMLLTSILGLFINIIMALTLHGHGHGHGHSHGHGHGHDHSHDNHDHKNDNSENEGHHHKHDHKHDHEHEHKHDHNHDH